MTIVWPNDDCDNARRPRDKVPRSVRKIEILARLTLRVGGPEIGVGDARITIKNRVVKKPSEASRVEFHFILTVVLSGKY